jgi:hypothetical protein
VVAASAAAAAASFAEGPAVADVPAPEPAPETPEPVVATAPMAAMEPREPSEPASAASGDTRQMPAVEPPPPPPTDAGKPPSAPVTTGGGGGSGLGRGALIGITGAAAVILVLFVVFLASRGGEEGGSEAVETTIAQEDEAVETTATTQATTTTTVAETTTTSGPEIREPEDLQLVETAEDDPAGGVVVRADASPDASEVGVLPGLTTFTTTGAVFVVEGTEWFEMAEPLEGWVSSDVVQAVEPGPRVTITGIELNGGAYEVEYEANFEPVIGGDAENLHIHFYFDTIGVEEAGLPGSGPWILYDVPSPFTGYGEADRPEEATQMCATVADVGHNLVSDRVFHCMDLPEA